MQNEMPAGMSIAAPWNWPASDVAEPVTRSWSARKRSGSVLGSEYIDTLFDHAVTEPTPSADAASSWSTRLLG